MYIRPIKCEKCGKKLSLFEGNICLECEEKAIQALEQEPCSNVVSRQAVEDKLLKLCNELEGIFANIRMQNQDESVCGLCEYDCPAPYECPGFDIEDCFKLADEIRHEWQSTKDLPPVNPQPKTGRWITKIKSDLRGDMWSTNPKCSECGGEPYYSNTIYNYKWCPYCGAKMQEVEE